MPLYRCEGGCVAQLPHTHKKHAVLHHQSDLMAVLCIPCSHGVPSQWSPDHPWLAGQQLQDGQREKWLLWHAPHPSSLPASAVLTAPLPSAPQNQMWACMEEQVRWVLGEKAINTSKTLLWLGLQPSTPHQSYARGVHKQLINLKGLSLFFSKALNCMINFKSLLKSHHLFMEFEFSYCFPPF